MNENINRLINHLAGVRDEIERGADISVSVTPDGGFFTVYRALPNSPALATTAKDVGGACEGDPE